MQRELVGQTLLNRYRVEALVGRGGMADVYAVWDTRRTVRLALKLLREDLALDKVFLNRFRREAQTLSRLEHPHIVRFYGLEQEDRLAFMLLDYIEGDTLKHTIFDLQGPMERGRLREVMHPVCSALHFAHSQGFIHCDVKPANIMLDRSGKVLVADFGIARMSDAATATMVGVGTPAYMAPEQVRGHDPLPQTDIYALGIVLYELLTGGQRPFTGERAQVRGTTSERVRWEQAHLPPFSPRQHNPALAPELEEVVLTCLEKEPQRRYGSALELLNRLGEALDSASSAAAARSAEPVVEPPMPVPPPEQDADAPASRLSEPRPAQEAARPAAEPVAMPARQESAPVRRAAAARRGRLPGWALAGMGVVVLVGLAAGGVSVMSGLAGGRAAPATPVVGVALGADAASPTLIETPTPTGTPPPTTEVLPLPARDPAALAFAGVTSNDDWFPHTQEFDGVPMALVPVGCFMMGSTDEQIDRAVEVDGVWAGPALYRDEQPAHRVCFEEPFWIDVYEVTNAQFAAFGGQAGRDSSWTEPNVPRESITWVEADAFCAKREVRLPTEAEWEYAARGPSARVFPWETDDCCYGWRGSRTARVDRSTSVMSWVGAYGFSGNVWEWVSDWYDPTYYSTLADGAVNPQGPNTGEYRVRRGGSWVQDPLLSNPGWRGADRSWYFPSLGYLDIGFRCARSWQP